MKLAPPPQKKSAVSKCAYITFNTSSQSQNQDFVYVLKCKFTPQDLIVETDSNKCLFTFLTLILLFLTSVLLYSLLHVRDNLFKVNIKMIVNKWAIKQNCQKYLHQSHPKNINDCEYKGANAPLSTWNTHTKTQCSNSCAGLLECSELPIITLKPHKIVKKYYKAINNLNFQQSINFDWQMNKKV